MAVRVWRLARVESGPAGPARGHVGPRGRVGHARIRDDHPRHRRSRGSDAVRRGPVPARGCACEPLRRRSVRVPRLGRSRGCRRLEAGHRRHRRGSRTDGRLERVAAARISHQGWPAGDQDRPRGRPRAVRSDRARLGLLVRRQQSGDAAVGCRPLVGIIRRILRVSLHADTFDRHRCVSGARRRGRSTPRRGGWSVRRMGRCGSIESVSMAPSIGSTPLPPSDGLADPAGRPQREGPVHVGSGREDARADRHRVRDRLERHGEDRGDHRGSGRGSGARDRPLDRATGRRKGLRRSRAGAVAGRDAHLRARGRHGER